MPTPKEGYFNSNGKKIPGTTQVISDLGWNKQPLMYWAWKEGKEGRNFRETSEAAADIGTQAHAMVEAHIKGLSIPAGDEKALAAFNEYLEWQKRTHIEIIGAEIKLVCNEFQFGSTIDGMGFYDGHHELLDWKSSNGCYPDMVIQLAAYGYNWMENNPDKPIVRVHLCRFGKQGGFHHHSWKWQDLIPAWECFKHLRSIHLLKKSIEGMV